MLPIPFGRVMRPLGTVSVSVAVETGGDADITVSPANLTFTTTTWSTPRTVTVSARDDDDAVNGSRQINHTAAGAEYAGVTGDVTATEQDDDEAGLDLSKTALSCRRRQAQPPTPSSSPPSRAASVTVNIVQVQRRHQHHCVAGQHDLHHFHLG